MNGVGATPDERSDRDGDRERTRDRDRRAADGGVMESRATNATDDDDGTDADEPIRVLHVDDDDAFVELAATFVTRTTDRLVVETETDARCALEHDLPATVDCVVSDYDMPSMNGLEFLQRVRDRWPTMPFILYTGKGSEEIASEAISAGVTDYLQKEVGTDQYEVLANRIRNAVDQHRAERRLEARDRRFRIAATESFDVIWDADVESGTVTWHGGLAEAFGFDDLDDVTTVSWWESRIHPGDRDRVVASIDDALESGGSWLAEYRFRDGAGEYAVVRTRGRCLADGDSVTMMGALTDVTAQREYERRLATLHRATTAMIDAADAAAAVDRVIAAVDDVLDVSSACFYEYVDGDGDRNGDTNANADPGSDSNDPATEIGSDGGPDSTPELRPLAWTDAVARATAGSGPDARPRTLTPADRAWIAFDESTVLEVDVRSRSRDRSESLESTDRPLALDGRTAELYLPVGSHGLLTIATNAASTIDRDERRLAEILTNELRAILDRTRRERSLEEHRRRLETLVSHLPGIAYRTRPDAPWAPEFVGGRVEELTGYPRDALETGDITFGEDLVCDADRPELVAAVETAIETRSPFELAYRITRRDGTERRVREHGEPVFEDDRVVALEGFILDDSRCE